jgi:hypothetical protein
LQDLNQSFIQQQMETQGNNTKPAAALLFRPWTDFRNNFLLTYAGLTAYAIAQPLRIIISY